MRCSFCDFWPNGVPSHQELSVAELERVADDLSRIGTFMVSIEAGAVRAAASSTIPAVGVEQAHMPAERAHDLDQIGPHERLPALDGDH